LKDAVIREKPFGKSINQKEKLKQLKELQAAYQDGADYDDVKTKIDEFLEDFNDEGPLKSALSKDIDLDEEHLAAYLKNLFDAIEGFEKPTEKQDSFRQPRGTRRAIQAAEAFKVGTKKNPANKRKSSRYTRKLRR